MITSRRSFLLGLGSTLVAASTVVRAASLMRVRRIVVPTLDEMFAITRQRMNNSLYGDLSEVTHKAFVPRLFVQLYREPPTRWLIEDLRRDAH